MKLTRMMVALSLGVGIVVGVTGTGSLGASTTVTDAQCGTTGKLTISPGLTPTPQAQAISVSGSIDNVLETACPNAPGSISGTLYSTSAYCNGDKLAGTPAVGRLTITWADKTKSNMTMHLSAHPEPQFALEVWLTGKVNTGHYAGDSVFAHLTTFIVGGEDCTSTPITTYNYNDTGGFHEKLLAFSHTA
jgi:hypothetical protein